MNTPEIPPPPKTPNVHLRGNGWAAALPSAVVVALITTFGGRFLAPSQDLERLRDDVRELRKDVDELTRTNAALLARLNTLDDNEKNARLIEALRRSERAP